LQFPVLSGTYHVIVVIGIESTVTPVVDFQAEARKLWVAYGWVMYVESVVDNLLYPVGAAYIVATGVAGCIGD
jgi:hypothetical protein